MKTMKMNSTQIFNEIMFNKFNAENSKYLHNMRKGIDKK